MRGIFSYAGQRKRSVAVSVLLGCLIPMTGLAGDASQPFQNWVKKGRLIAPGFAGPKSSTRVSAPSVVRLSNGRLRMYFWATAQDGSNYIFAAEALPDDIRNWKLVRSEPLLGPVPKGNITDKGPGFPYVLPRQGAPWLMYYGAWGSWAPPGELSNRTGLAVSDDEGLTWRIVDETVLPLGRPGKYDAGLTGSVCVLQTSPERYDMWYTAGERYAILDWIRPGFKRGIVHVGHARSSDGMKWVKSACPVLSPRLDSVKGYEAVVSKPAVIVIDGVYHMWLSVFTMDGGYRLNYARSEDGVEWVRYPDKEIMRLSPGEFDSENQSYANLVDMGDELWMFYTGNNFGATGIGLAALKKSELERR
ncbi:MAG: hypothetical protein ACE15E_04440 [Acidobacteriota bacterium]